MIISVFPHDIPAPMSKHDLQMKHTVKMNKCSKITNKYFSHYAAETSIHGIKYLNENNRHWFER